MPLLEIACPRCAHRGFIAADRLPGILQRSGCGFAELVSDGVRTIRSPDADVVQAKPKRPRPPRRKRILVPGELRQQRHKPKMTASDLRDDAA